MHNDFAQKRRLSNKYKRRTNKYHTASTANTTWIWMISGLVLGLCLSGLLYRKTHPHQHIPVDKPIAINENIPTKSEKLPSKQNTASRFDFYTVLPENEAKADPYYNPKPVDPTRIAQNTQPKKPEIKPFVPLGSNPSPLSTDPFALKPKPFAPNTDPYILQVGSFRHYHQADKLRTQLAHSNIKASIQTFKLNQQETWYRVYLGPFKNRDEALQQQAQIEQSQPVHSLIVKFCV